MMVRVHQTSQTECRPIGFQVILFYSLIQYAEKSLRIRSSCGTLAAVFNSRSAQVRNWIVLDKDTVVDKEFK